MLSSLLRPRRNRPRVEEHSPYSSLYPDNSSPLVARRERQIRHASADWTETEVDDENTDDEEEDGDENDDDAVEDDDDDDANQDEGEDGESDAPLLPLFSAAHLDALPVYNLTHAIRLIVVPRTETTLTWEQLRSPQVSQFLVKPMQQQIRTSHFNRATLYALMANCLQFQKEGQMNPGNVGTSRTRAMVCELLAIKLLKEYNTRELIDALSYDFFPLQGLQMPAISTPAGNINRPRPVAARISTLEVAIRASAKHFLAHAVVVQQLEAIWAGTIVFHSAADNLHRRQATPPQKQMEENQKPNGSSQRLLVPGQQTTYGAINTSHSSPNTEAPVQAVSTRRTVTLYDPRDASLFKLSRLRVPRYRQFFSTCSLAILIGLFLAVLMERSMKITWLEVVFWFWSAGFMLDEVVGFNEQGFSLYLMSFWNIFDLGMLALLIVYYSMRLYGIALVDNLGRREWNNMAYDVLATNAILLFPRLFSVLDHYRYFSQLLIAFRLMAIDLVAVFILILIACSGFFAAFTLSFGTGAEYDAAGVAYRIFQILMGFTPAAWEVWADYNALGKVILVLFLTICHFLVVTILITVLTNSFMTIVLNANEEHQFVFAVNTISMVKNDALFSYVAPSNIFAWLLTPLRFLMPFKTYIKLNRTIIKVSHFPLLFCICAYEKLFLARSVFEPTDLVDSVTRGRPRLVSFKDPSNLFSPGTRLRNESMGGIKQDKALEEVFRLAPRPETLRSTQKSAERRKTHNVVSNWMDHQGDQASPPQEQDRSIVDRLEARRLGRKSRMRLRGVSGTRSVASDPAEFISTGGAFTHDSLHFGNDGDHEGDGDDELVTNDEDEGVTLDKSRHSEKNSDSEEDESYFRTPTGANTLSPATASRKARILAEEQPKASPPKRRLHMRNPSTNTILFNPVTSKDNHTSSSSSPPKPRPKSSRANTGTHTPISSQHPSGARTPRHSIYTTANTKPRPIMPARTNFQSVPNLNDLGLSRTRQIRHKVSSLDMGMSDLGFDTNPNVPVVPSSFATQMHMATAAMGMGAGRGNKRGEDTDGVMGRLMLAKMKTLEEGLAEVVREFRELRTAGNSSVEGAGEYTTTDRGKGKGRGKGDVGERDRDRDRRRKRPAGVSRTTSAFDFAGGVRGDGANEGENEGEEYGAAAGDDRSEQLYKGTSEQGIERPRIMRRYTSKGSSL